MKGMTFLDRDNETFNATGDAPYTPGVLFFVGLGEEISSKKVKQANTDVMFKVKRNKNKDMQEFLIRNEYHKWLGMTGRNNWLHVVSRRGIFRFKLRFNEKQSPF